MSLPKVEMPKDEVDVQGNKVPVRGLSRAEFLKISQDSDGDVESAEIACLALGAGVSADEAKEWRENAPAGDVGRVLDRIAELSGVGTDQGE